MEQLPSVPAPVDEDAQSPKILDESEFPPLPSHQTMMGMLTLPTNTVVTRSVSPSSSNSPRTRTPSLKRSLTQDTEVLSQNDGSSSSQTSCQLDTTSPPPLKAQRLLYRDNNPMQSLDSELFRSMFNSPTLSDSQQSTDTWTSSVQLKASYNASLNSLGSLGDIFNNATLDSMKGLPSVDMDENSCLRTEQVTLRDEIALLSPPNVLQFMASRQNSDEKSSEKSDLASSNLNATVKKGGYHVEKKLMVHPDKAERMSSSSSAESGRQTLSSFISSSSQSVESLSSDQISDFTRSSSFEQEKTDNEEKTVTEDKKTEEKKTEEKEEKKEPDLEEEEKKEPDRVKEEEKEESDIDSEEDSSCDEVAETFYSNEDLQSMFDKCKKNPKHKKFRTPDNLKVNDLPPEIQHEDTITFLTCMSQLVVQITVGATSAGRGPNDMYSSYIGTDKKRNGSGFVANVDPEVMRFRCKRKDCTEGSCVFSDSISSLDSSGLTSPKFDRSLSNMSTASSASTSSVSSSSGRRKHYYYSGVNIRTNKHVIFDKTEADTATVKFFFHSDNEHEVIHGHVGAIIGMNDKQDHVTIHVMSHEKKLFNMLESCLKNARLSYQEMIKSTQIAHQIHGKKFPHSWVAVISHPHGAPKRISLGRVMQERLEMMRVVKYYNAATCPGSSGGLVITPTLLKLQWPGAVHSCYEKKSQLNVTFDSRFPDLSSSEMDRINKTLVTSKDFVPEIDFQ